MDGGGAVRVLGLAGENVAMGGRPENHWVGRGFWVGEVFGQVGWGPGDQVELVFVYSGPFEVVGKGDVVVDPWLGGLVHALILGCMAVVDKTCVVLVLVVDALAWRD